LFFSLSRVLKFVFVSFFACVYVECSLVILTHLLFTSTVNETDSRFAAADETPSEVQWASGSLKQLIVHQVSQGDSRDLTGELDRLKGENG
jgi:hypothetical protein